MQIQDNYRIPWKQLFNAWDACNGQQYNQTISFRSQLGAVNMKIRLGKGTWW